MARPHFIRELSGSYQCFTQFYTSVSRLQLQTERLLKKSSLCLLRRTLQVVFFVKKVNKPRYILLKNKLKSKSLFHEIRSNKIFFIKF